MITIDPYLSEVIDDVTPFSVIINNTIQLNVVISLNVVAAQQDVLFLEQAFKRSRGLGGEVWYPVLMTLHTIPVYWLNWGFYL